MGPKKRSALPNLTGMAILPPLTMKLAMPVSLSPSLSTRKEYADGCPAALQRPNSCRKRERGKKFCYERFTLKAKGSA